MAKRERPLRSWNIDMLFVLGKREGTKAKHLRAVPVLILESWVRGGKVEGKANYIWTTDVAKRLEESGLVHPFKPKGTSVLLASLTTIQSSRNLNDPPLIEYQGMGYFWINLPHYEPLLQEYRPKYQDLYPEDYKNLFPDGEPDWGWSFVGKGRSRETKDINETQAESIEEQDMKDLLAPVQQAFREKQREIQALTDENNKLREQIRQVISYRRIVDDELRTDCAKYLENRETYIDAIRRASVVLEQRLYETVGVKKLLIEGVELVDYALMPKTGRLIISDHPAEQDGVRMLFRGAVQFVRNPPAHKKVQYNEREAWQTINLIDYLLLLLKQARPRKHE